MRRPGPWPVAAARRRSARDLTNRSPHLAQRLEASPVDAFEEPVEGRGAELVDGDGLIAEADVPRSRRGGYIVEHRRDDGAFRETVEPLLGDDEQQATRFVAAISEPYLAG